MNDIFKNLSALKQEALTESERVVLRTKVISLMKVHPVRLPEVSRHHYHGEYGIATLPVMRKLTVTSKRMIAIIVGIMVAISGGAGVSYAAEGSLPGDMLYPVKIHVNERAGGALAFSAEAKAEHARKGVIRRAEEARRLEENNRLDVDARATLAAETKTHLEEDASARKQMLRDGNEEAAMQSKAAMEHVVSLHQEFLFDLDLENATSLMVSSTTDAGAGITVKSGTSHEGTRPENERTKVEVKFAPEATVVGNTHVNTGEVKIETMSDVRLEVQSVLNADAQGSDTLRLGL